MRGAHSFRAPLPHAGRARSGGSGRSATAPGAAAEIRSRRRATRGDPPTRTLRCRWRRRAPSRALGTPAPRRLGVLSQRASAVGDAASPGLSAIGRRTDRRPDAPAEIRVCLAPDTRTNVRHARGRRRRSRLARRHDTTRGEAAGRSACDRPTQGTLAGQDAAADAERAFPERDCGARRRGRQGRARGSRRRQVARRRDRFRPARQLRPAERAAVWRTGGRLPLERGLPACGTGARRECPPRIRASTPSSHPARRGLRVDR